MIHTESLCNDVEYYGVAMNDHINVVIHHNHDTNTFSCCGATQRGMLVATDTNSNSLWKIVPHTFVESLLAIFGAWCLNEGKYDAPTCKRTFTL